jgi:beta-mannosidase
MEYHQRSGIGNATIMHYLLAWFRLPGSYWATLWASQIVQAEIIKYAIEHWRRSMPRTMGALYWQLNDIWPGPSWSSLDFEGRWKALHYAARRFFAPLLITGVEDTERGAVDVWLTSDRLEAVQAEARWRITTTGGDLLAEGAQAVTMPANGSAHAFTVDAARQMAEVGMRRLLVWLELHTGGEQVSDNLVWLARPKHLELEPPTVRLDVHTDADMWHITLVSDKPALWVWVEHEQGPVAASDNFFHLAPGVEKRLTVTAARGFVPDLLRVHSILDLEG